MGAKIVKAGEGRHGRLGGMGVRWMVTGDESGGGFSLVEHPLGPHALGAPLHRHSREDEYSYVLEAFGFYWRERRSEFNVIKHALIPLIGVLAMIPAIMSVIGGLTIPFFDVKLDPYTTSLRFTAPIVGVWMILGILIYFWLAARNPSALQRMGEIYGGEASPED